MRKVRGPDCEPPMAAVFWALLMNQNLLRRLSVLLAVVAVVYAALACWHTVGDFDTGWQMATGRWALAHRQIPGTDVLSYTTAGAVWHYPSLAGVLFYLIFSATGYAGLGSFCALASGLLMAWILYRSPGRGLAIASLAILAVPSLAHRLTPRADLFTTVLFALVLIELWRHHRNPEHRLWSLPILFLLWANLHPGYVAGLALLAAYCAVELLELPWPARRAAALARLRSAAPWLVAAGVATLINPWGWEMLRSAGLLTASAGHQSGFDFRSHITEWTAVRITPRAMLQAFDLSNPESSYWWLLAATVIAALAALWQRRMGALLLLVAASLVSVRFIRFQGIFALVVIVVGGEVLAGSFEPLQSRGDRFFRSRWVQVAVIAAMLLLVGYRVTELASDRTYVHGGDVVDFGAGESWWYPERAASFILHEKLPGNIFQPFNIGGFTALRLGPQYPEYIDGRSINGELFEEQERLLHAPPDGLLWREVADARGIQTILLSLARNGGLQDVALPAFCQSREWAPVYMDEVSVVLLRRNAQNEPLISRLALDCRNVHFSAPADTGRAAQYQFHANAGAVFYVLSRDEEAEQHWKQAEALFPNDPNVHIYLAQLYTQQRRVNEAEAQYLAALRSRQSATAAYGLGRLYGAEHRWSEAEGAISLAAELELHPANQYKALAQVQLHLNKPAQAEANLLKAERAGPAASDPTANDFRAQIAEGRAEVARQSGNLSQAIALQQEATRQTPQSIGRWQKLAALATAANQQGIAAEAASHAQSLEAAAKP